MVKSLSPWKGFWSGRFAAKCRIEQDGDYKIEPLGAEVNQRMAQRIVEAQEVRRGDLLECKDAGRGKSRA